MGRKSDPLYLDKKWNVFYARWYEDKKRFRCSLGTGDRIEANRRLPIVISARMGWDEYRNTFADLPNNLSAELKGLGRHSIAPPIALPATRDGIICLIDEANRNHTARYNQETGEWILVFGEENGDDAIEGINFFRNALSKEDKLLEIESFYKTTAPQLYLDKKTAARFSEIWLRFLNEKSITGWNQITEQLCTDFKAWRKTTPISRNNRPGVCPSNLVINRHMQFLKKTFDEAVAHEFFRTNPIRNWKPETHNAPTQNSLSVDDLKKVICSPKLQRNYLINGCRKEHLEYKLSDVILLLFVSCKRRKEILSLEIKDINFAEHWVHYVEYKNSSKGTSYSIDKAFWITPAMAILLKKIIGNRTSGLLFPCPPEMKKGSIETDGLNPEYISAIFKEIVDELDPEKNITLQNLRHTATDIMEKAGLSDQEQDYTLGHYNVKTALKNYQNKSADAIGRRLSELTRKGIEVLSNTVKDLLP